MIVHQIMMFCQRPLQTSLRSTARRNSVRRRPGCGPCRFWPEEIWRFFAVLGKYLGASLRKWTVASWKNTRHFQGWSFFLPYGYGSIPNFIIFYSIFRGLFTSILTQLFWCELQGYYWFWHTAIYNYIGDSPAMFDYWVSRSSRWKKTMRVRTRLFYKNT